MTEVTRTLRVGVPVWRPEVPVVHRAPVSGSRRCHTAVIGAGLTGLSVALRLAQRHPDRDVVVLEAARVASGASGRGTGLVGPRIGPPLRTARRRYGDERARALHIWSERAVEHVIALCARHHIDCGLTPGSQLLVARDRRARIAMERESAAAAALGVRLTVVAADEMPAGAGRSLGGLRYAPAATVDPAAFATQLAFAAERLGATVHENSPVRRIRHGDGPIRLSTDAGEVLADRVVVAVNGSGANSRTGVLGMRVQAAATVPLTNAQLAELGWLRDEPLAEIGDLAPYYRLTPEGRLVVGGGRIERGAHGSDPLDVEYLRAAVRALHPVVRDVPLEYAWSGPIGMTLDAMPVIGARGGGEMVAVGWRGHGIAASTYAGTLLADRLGAEDGSAPEVFPIPRGRAPALPSIRPVLRLLDLYLARLGRARDRALDSPSHDSGVVRIDRRR
ncbi:NAD(P)/FAD-dependent oxidoreductase [Nocardia bovistercoris]|uniref:FAD-binding oxidoreductase n=1 Tax=Nocardia bovistercoris TaxID=2785916 RepID=A0A931IHK6_9NOCA|nr:FAD-binding oxidoreductase [Nocardia bovistercoris]MBH0781574.1 FAD-binding oxidoreductase [Nocardia bovistercoris]